MHDKNKTYNLSLLTKSILGSKQSQSVESIVYRIALDLDDESLITLVDVLDRNECTGELGSFTRWYIDRNPSARSLLFLANALRRSRHYAFAHEAYQAVQKSDSSSEFREQTYTGITHILFQQRKLPLALATVEDALVRFPTVGIFHALKGAILTALNQHPEAVTSLGIAVALHPNNAAFLEQLGETYARMAEQETDSAKRAVLQKESIGANQNAVILAPDRVRAWTNLASMLSALGKQNEALKASGQAMKLDDSYFPAIFNHASILFQDNRFMDSIDCLQKAEKLNPRSAEVHLLKGMVYWELNDALASWNSFRTCLAISPNNPDAKFYLQELEKRIFN